MCRCSAGERLRYARRLSGPLLDRIDLHVPVPPVPWSDLQRLTEGEPSAAVRARVESARRVASERFAGRPDARNALLSASDFSRFLALEPSAGGLLAAAVDRMGLSVRAVHRALRVARTIADLEMSQMVDPKHLAEALGYRSRVFGEESDRLDRAPLGRLPSMATQAQAVKQLGLSKPRSRPA